MRRSNVKSEQITDVTVIENLGNQVTKYGNNEYLAEKITCNVNGKPKTYIRNSYKNGMVEYMI